MGTALPSALLGDVAGTARLADEAENRAVRFSQSQILAQVAGVRGFIAHYRGDLPGAERLLSQAVGELRRLGWTPVQAEYLSELAAVAIAMGKLDQAQIWARDLREVAEAGSEYLMMAESQALLARIALLRQDIGAARILIHGALEIASDAGARFGMASGLTVAAQADWAAGNAYRATMLRAGAARVRHTTGYVHPAPRARELEREQAAIRTSLGQTAYDAAGAECESMNDAELIASVPPP